jgi:hypothetical protein
MPVLVLLLAIPLNLNPLENVPIGIFFTRKSIATVIAIIKKY